MLYAELAASENQPILIKVALPVTVSIVFDGTLLRTCRGSAQTVGELLERLINQNSQSFPGMAADNLTLHVSPDMSPLGHSSLLASSLHGSGSAAKPLVVKALVPASVRLSYEGTALNVPTAGSVTVLELLV